MQYSEWILERAFGGTHVADAPGASQAQSNWVEGHSTPASREACDLLLAACKNKEVNESCLVFLVGGAGNGKSYLAREVSVSLEGKLRGEPSLHASRLYEYDLSTGRQLRIINDATIPPPDQWESGGNALRSDIDVTVEQRGHLLCCVNRGVLVREAMAEGSPESIGGAVVAWMAGNSALADQLPEGWRSSAVSQEPARDHYAFARLEAPDAVAINVHVVFMDNPSLLEPHAETKAAGDPSRPLETARRSVASVWKNNAAQPRSVSAAVHETILKYAEELASQDSANAADPVWANAQMLSDPGVVAAWSSVLRGGEVISGTHFTYRDVWGLVSLSLTGALQGNTMKEHADWVASRIAELESGDWQIRLRALQGLATLRTHQAMFSASPHPAASGGACLDQSYPTAQAHRSVRLADPVRSLDRELRKTLSDKLFLLEEKEKPGASLASSDSQFKACWTQFDQMLENLIVAWLHSDEADGTGDSSRKQVSKRRALIAWYGEYLSRLLSFSHGFPAFPALVHSWQVTWKSASLSTSVAALDDKLEAGLLDLAFPASAGKCVLPVFDEHIVPPQEGTKRPRVLIQLRQSEYRVRGIARGDRIVLKLVHDLHGGERELILDFPLLRETLVRHDGVGFTEAMFDVEPRVERLRAGGVMLATGQDVDQIASKIRFAIGDHVISSNLA